VYHLIFRLFVYLNHYGKIRHFNQRGENPISTTDFLFAVDWKVLCLPSFSFSLGGDEKKPLFSEVWNSFLVLKKYCLLRFQSSPTIPSTVHISNIVVPNDFGDIYTL